MGSYIERIVLSWKRDINLSTSRGTDSIRSNKIFLPSLIIFNKIPFLKANFEIEYI
jgi:hypothetical protein